MLCGGFCISRQQILISLIGVKCEKIKVLRQQYDAFLEEDKKRKERNEYILTRLDKMRSCDYLIPYRPQVHLMQDKYQLNPFVPTTETIKENLSARSQVALRPVDSSFKGIDEFLNEITQKYILIPKLQNARDNGSLLQKTDDKPSFSDDIDWKSKYDILNRLKQEEKEDGTNPIDKGNQKFKDAQILDSQLNEQSIDISSSTVGKCFNKYEKPERDSNDIETSNINRKIDKQPNRETGLSISSAAIDMPKSHKKTNVINTDLNKLEVSELQSERSESRNNYIKDNSHLLQKLASMEDTNVQPKVGLEFETYKNEQISHKTNDTISVMTDGQDVEKPQHEYNVSSYAECEGKNGIAKEDFQYENNPTVVHAYVTDNDAVQHEIDQSPVFVQDYVQQVAGDYNPPNYVEGENTAYENEHYAYEDQQYYNGQNLPQAQEYEKQAYQQQENPGQDYHGQENQGQEYHGQEIQGQEYLGQKIEGQEYHGQEIQGQEYHGPEIQGQEYHGQGIQGQEYHGQEIQGQEYHGQQYQGQEYEGQYITGSQNYDILPQGETNAVNISYENPIEQHLLSKGSNEQTKNETYYLETPSTEDGLAVKLNAYDDQAYTSDMINPTPNPDYTEDIRDFETEADMYNTEQMIDFPEGPVGSGISIKNNSEQPIPMQEDYTNVYEDNQTAQNPLDVYDQDATLQKYDQSYGDQYTGNYEEVPAIEETQVMYEPVQTQEIDYDNEPLENIEKTLDYEQNYTISNNLQNPPDEAVVQETNVQPKEQGIVHEVISPVKRETN